MKKENKMPASVDFSEGERGKFFGKFKYANHTTRRNPETCFAICLLTDDPELLIPLKIYRVEMSDAAGYLQVTNESGDAKAYPERYFALVSFPQDIERRLKEAQQAA
ncbi:MAG: hypothetical protein ABR577_16200 [Pyrinomonadaceae bacterium]